MLGNMLSKIRKDKKITKVELAKKTKINIGHLTHIEKGERNPSHKALRTICKALGVPYQPLAYLYDKPMTEDQVRYKALNHINYNKVIAVDSFDTFIECPVDIPNASIAFKILDDSMEPKFQKNSYAFLELNVPLSNREFGLFEYNGEKLVRRFIVRKDKLILRAENKNCPEIELSEDDNFIIIGRVIPNSK
jgi:transcriptional regulator with XRE-family HTH domain